MRFILNKKIIILLVSIFVISSFSRIVFSAWNGTFYNPGDTLNPECSPTDTDCDVLSPLTSTNISNTAYDASTWDGVTTISPSKDAIRDKFESLVIGNHNAVTIGTANGLSLATQVVSLALASTSSTGALSDTDWDIFNNKFDLPALTSGSVLFSNGTTISQDNSNLFWDDTNNRLGVGTSSPLTKLDVAGSSRITGTASSTLTGTADPTASTTLVGTGTLFTTELVIGDRITVNAETRTVTAIASDTSLTVDTAFTDTASASITKLPAVFIARISDNTPKFVINDLGNVNIGTTTLDSLLGVGQTSTSSVAGEISQIKSSFVINPSADQPLGNYIGDKSGAIRYAINGIGTIPVANTHKIDTIEGVYGTAENYGTGLVNNIIAIHGFGYNAANATVNKIVGAGIYSESDAGTVGNLTGSDVWSGVYGGTVADLYGVAVVITNDGGTVNNRYGLYLQLDGSATNDYGIYEKTAQKNYFAGNIGIGTTSPTNILSLGGTTARTIWMERNTTAGTAGQGLTLSSGGAIAGTADLAGGDLTLKSGISTGTGTSAIHFYTATAGTTGTSDNTPTEKMTILGSGNVGIGTTAPSTTFHSYSTASNYQALFERPSGDSAISIKGIGGQWVLGSSVTGGNVFAIQSGNGFTTSSPFNITTAGNVGINNTNPTKKLVITDAVNTLSIGDYSSTGYGPEITSSNSQIVLPSKVWLGSSQAYFGGYTTSYGAQLYGDHGTSLMYYNRGSSPNYYPALYIPSYYNSGGSYGSYGSNAGNVGIGTITPTSLLHVTQRTFNPGTVTVSGTSVTGTGTQFTNTFKVGDTITVTTTSGSETKAITTITSNTVLVTESFTGTATDVAYSFVGGDRFVVKGNGSVGIGTTSPNFTLHIGSSVATDFSSALQFTNSGTGTTSTDGIKMGLGNTSDFYFVNQESVGKVVWKLNSGDRFVLQPDGSVGLGGTISSISTLAGSALTITGTTGNVGIGTTSPGSALEVSGNIALSSSGNTLRFSNDANEKIRLYSNTYGLGIGTGLLNYVAASGAHAFYVGGTVAVPSSEAMRITTGGNVGIGTTSPLTKLHVWSGEASAGQQEILRMEGNFTTNGDGPLLRFTNQHNSGDNPNAQEYNLAGIQGRDFVGNWAGGLVFMTPNSGDSGGSALVDRMVVRENGNVGIATTTPLKTLDVAGGGRFTGKTSSTLTGTADPTASTTLVGVGTLFTTELVIGDRITVNAETRTVTAIASDTSLTVDSAFTDTASASITKLPAVFIARISDNTPKFVINDLGNVGIGATGPDTGLHIRKNPGIGIGSVTATGGAPGGGLSTNWNVVSQLKIDQADLNSNGLAFFVSGTNNERKAFIQSGHSMKDFASYLGTLSLNPFGGNVGIGTVTPQSLLDVQGPTGTGATGAGILTLATKELTIVDGDQLGRINFNSPLESDGSDAILAGASIWAEADDTFSTTVNSTELVFGTATTSAAIERMRIDSAGNVGIGTSTPGYLLHVGSTSVTDATVLLRLEDADSTCDFTANAGAPACGSDETLKKNVVDLTGSIDKVTALRPISYNWLTDTDGVNVKYGFIAQEVATIMPELVTDGTWIDGTTRKFLQMEGMTPYIIGAIKEMNLGLTMPDVPLTETIDGIETKTFAGKFFEKLSAWLSNAENKITRIFTGEVCLTEAGEETVCINRAELKSLKALLNQSSGSSSEPSSSESAAPAPEPEPEPEPAPTETPTVEEPTVEEPVIEEPIVETPTEEAPVVEEPVAETPAE